MRKTLLSMLFLLILAAALAATASAQESRDYGYSSPLNLSEGFQQVDIAATDLNTPNDDGIAYMTPDGLAIYFSSDRLSGFNWEVFTATRPDTSSSFNSPTRLSSITAGTHKSYPWLSDDQKTIYFTPQVGGVNRIYKATRSDLKDSFGPATDLTEITGSVGGISLMPDELTIYYALSGDIYRATRSSAGSPFGNIAAVTELNSASGDGDPCVSRDGLTMFFISDRPPHLGGGDIWYSWRPTVSSAWSTPAKVTELSTDKQEGLGAGCMNYPGVLYYHRDTLGNNIFDIYYAVLDSCYDSGDDFYVKGYVKITQAGNSFVRYDECMDDGRVQEQTCCDCVDYTGCKNSCSKYLNCPNSCKDGACIKTIPVISGKPYCGATGSRSEGWYDSSGLIRYDNCAKCSAKCDATGSRSEGWYSSCDGKLIKYGKCAETPEPAVVKEQVKCVFLKVSVAATTSVATPSIVQTAPQATQTVQNAANPGAAQATQSVANYDTKQAIQKCYTDDGKFGCSGVETCIVDVSGEKGKRLTWKSSCGGYAYTTIDGVDEYAKFSCIEQPVPSSCPPIMRPYCPNGSLVSQGNDENGCPRQSVCAGQGVCTEQYEPVCGSDGNTYSNSCFAGNAGVKWKEGACEETKKCENGCMLDSRCMSYGFRHVDEDLEPVQYRYCDISGEFRPQKKEGSSCQNNYECTSNQCSNGKCIDLEKQLRQTQGMMEKIMEWLRSIFGGKKVDGG